MLTFSTEKESSAAIPIPSQQHSRGTSLINQRIDEYDDPTTNNSSYNSQDQFRYAPNSVETRGSVEEVQRRRSFHGTPEQLHHTSSAQEQMQQYRQGSGSGGKQHAKSFDNYSGKHFQQQQGAGGAAAPLHPAESSPSGGHSYLNEGVAAGIGGGRSSRVSVPIAIAGATATAAAAHGVMRHHSGYASSSASSHSTPPFSLLEQRVRLFISVFEFFGFLLCRCLWTLRALPILTLQRTARPTNSFQPVWYRRHPVSAT